MEPLIYDRLSHGQFPCCDGYAPRQRLSDVQVDTDPGKFTFEAKQGVLVNSDYLTHMLDQLVEAFQVPEFPRQSRNSNPLVHFGDSSMIGVEERDPTYDNKIKIRPLINQGL